MGAGPPKENKNAEKWNLENATLLFNDCLAMSQDKTNTENDFLGEIAQEFKTSLSTLDYLKTKFPELETIYKEMKSNCEANCFRNGKKGKIVPSLAIMNLKSNHNWTDRTSQDVNVKGAIQYTPEDREKKIKELMDKAALKPNQ